MPTCRSHPTRDIQGEGRGQGPNSHSILQSPVGTASFLNELSPPQCRRVQKVQHSLPSPHQELTELMCRRSTPSVRSERVASRPRNREEPDTCSTFLAALPTSSVSASKVMVKAEKETNCPPSRWMSTEEPEGVKPIKHKHQEHETTTQKEIKKRSMGAQHMERTNTTLS